MTRHLESNTKSLFEGIGISLMSSKQKTPQLTETEKEILIIIGENQPISKEGIIRKFVWKYSGRSEPDANKKQSPKTNTAIRNLRVIPESKLFWFGIGIICGMLYSIIVISW